MDACLQALGRRHMLVQVIENLIQPLADVGVLLNLGLELVKQRGVNQGRHLGVLCRGGGCMLYSVSEPNVCKVELCSCLWQLSDVGGLGLVCTSSQDQLPQQTQAETERN